jgi:hypothetical protein
MAPKKELQLAYWLMIILFFVGGICYAAFPAKTPEDPVRKMFKTAAGKVLFTHSLHKADSGYGISCADCHHHYEEDESELRACGDCHGLEESKKVPEACLDCHEPDENHHPGDAEDSEPRTCNECHLTQGDEALPEACGDCHDPDEIEAQEKPMNFQKRTDAFHTQCVKCHQDYGSGPVECASCHVM